LTGSAMSENNDMSRMCAVGLLTTDYYDDIDNFGLQAEEAKHDFIVTPISHPTLKHVLNNDNPEEHANWKDSPAFNRKDLIVKSAGKQKKTVSFTFFLINFVFNRIFKQDHWIFG
jgi:hypothetical protein